MEPESPHAFTPPDVEPRIEFKKVRRGSSSPPPGRVAGGRFRFSGGRRFSAFFGRHRRLVLAVGLPVVLVLAVGGWFGGNGYAAAGHLRTAAGLLTTLRRQLTTGDVSDAQLTLAALRKQVRAAHSDADALPAIGANLSATRTIAAVLDDLANRGLPPLVTLAATMRTALHGHIDPAVLRRAAPTLAAAGTIIAADRRRIEALHAADLAGPLRSKLPTLISGLKTVEKLTAPAAQAAQLLPGLLGADGPRTYLVLFQNLAEVRATGGMPGAFVVLQANQGSITIVDQGTAAATLGTFRTPVLPIDPDMDALWTDRIGTFPADINLTPDFPTAAATAREMYRQRTGRTVDGVLATDPVALSYLLRATGPVPITGYPTLTSTTAVAQLLNQAYLDIPVEAQQDAYFASVAKAVFDALLTQHVDPGQLVSALVRAVSERRILVWSAHPDEETRIARTSLAGQLPLDDGSHPTVGVFLDDGSGAKLDYYLTHAASLVTGPCGQDGSMALGLSVQLGSTAPATGLPVAITGLALSGSPTTMRTNVLIYSPTGGAVVQAELDGTPVDLGTGVERGRAVGVLPVDLAPGSTHKLAVTLLTSALPDRGATVAPRLVTTPGITPWAGSGPAPASCAK